MKKIIVTLVLIISTSSFAQVGIGTTDPKATLDVVGKPSVPTELDGFLPPRITRAELIAKTGYGLNQKGSLVYVTDLSGVTNAATAAVLTTGLSYFDGTVWKPILTSANNLGDIKTGIQTTDHNGWIKLDGRAIATLTVTQQAGAMTLGIGTNLPNATDAFLVQNGTALGSVSSSNTKTIAQSNLPNVTFTGTTASAGGHQHYAFNSNNNFNNSSPGSNLGYSANDTSNQGGNSFSSDQAYTNTAATQGATSVAGTHIHTVTVESGGSGTALDITPKSLSVNTFIYLGN